MRVMEEMFDVPAVLRGRKPVSQLAGLWPIAGWFCTVFVGMGMTVLDANTMRDTQSTLYLRNFGSFARAMGARVSVVILDSINQVWLCPSAEPSSPSRLTPVLVLRRCSSSSARASPTRGGSSCRTRCTRPTSAT